MYIILHIRTADSVGRAPPAPFHFNNVRRVNTMRGQESLSLRQNKINSLSRHRQASACNDFGWFPLAGVAPLGFEFGACRNMG